MGHGLFREPLHRLYKFSPDARGQFDTVLAQYGEFPVSHAVRAVRQSDSCPDAVCRVYTVPGGSNLNQRTRLAAERRKRI